jgi:copper chaperone CopZ
MPGLTFNHELVNDNKSGDRKFEKVPRQRRCLNFSLTPAGSDGLLHCNLQIPDETTAPASAMIFFHLQFSCEKLLSLSMHRQSFSSLTLLLALVSAHSFAVLPALSRPTGDELAVRRSSCHHLQVGRKERQDSTIVVKAEPRDDASSVTSYHLMWSPHMLPRFLAAFASLLTVRLIVGPHVVLSSETIPAYPGFAGKVLEYLVLPLLSSACCSVQLLVNVMVGAGGCAGFNKRLGPLRPFFLAIMFITLLTPATRSNYATLYVQILLAFLPELVHGWNRLSETLLTRKQTNRVRSLASDATSAQVELNIPGMGCVACINKINNSLRQVPTVASSEAWLQQKGGKAKVHLTVRSNEEAQTVAVALVDAVRAAGFDPCEIDVIQMNNTAS